MTTKGRSVRSHPLSHCISVSNHAIHRWISRIGVEGCRREKDVVLKILDLLYDAIPVTETLFYSHGVMLGIVDDTVTTVFPPRTSAQKVRVKRALERHRAVSGRT